ncbi:hypothetical protein HRG84_08410 [Flavisolibacter sp. BT320]|nr:hypothetical protein [Flavisolibacter longurius]
MKKRLLLLFVLLQTLLLSAQDVDGFWKGSLTFVGGCFAQNNLELQIKMVGDGIYGSSYHFMDENNFIRKDASGYYDPETKKLVVQEGAVTAQQLVDRCSICVKRFNLTYRKEGNLEYLEGYWVGKLQGTNIDCGTGGTITLSRTTTPVFKEELVPTIKVDTGEIRLRFYDNATIDGDSISVTVNGKTVLSHEKLSTKPITTMVKVSLETPVVEVVMVAENEGSIPPNTALLEIMAGEVYHRLFMSSTKEKSARVRFVYDKKLTRNTTAVSKDPKGLQPGITTAVVVN